ncbi:MAG: DUF6476 family protein [Pseudomonadota bacterium]
MPKTPDPDPAPPPALDPALVSYLKRLVTVLTVVMVIGVVTIVGLLVSRLHSFGQDDNGTDRSSTLALPDTIVLPEGSTATAFTKGRDWYAVVTQADKILIFDAASGELTQVIDIE